MKTVDLNSFGPTITNETVADQVLRVILEAGIEAEPVMLDVSNLITMTTKCAKHIFGHLYQKLGSDKYYMNVLFKGKSETLGFVIDMGIENYNS